MPGLTIAKALIEQPDGFMLYRPPGLPGDTAYDFVTAPVYPGSTLRATVNRELRGALGIDGSSSVPLWGGEYVDPLAPGLDPTHIHLFGVTLNTVAGLGRSVVAGSTLLVPKDADEIERMAEKEGDQRIGSFARAALTSYVNHRRILNIPGAHTWA